MFSSDTHASELFHALTPYIQDHEWCPIDRHLVHKNAADQVLIGEVVELPERVIQDFFADRPYQRLFLTKVFPNLECKFCFDHPLDHYPLMMLLEVGRQLGTAISHRFYEVPLAGYVGIGDSIAVNFKRFIELDSPVFVLSAESDFRGRKATQHRASEVSFLQGGNECAYGNGSLTVLARSMYQKFRVGSRAQISGRSTSTLEGICTNQDLAARLRHPASVHAAAA
jgi:hypothetical protein